MSGILTARFKQDRRTIAFPPPQRIVSGDRWEIVRKYYLALPFRVVRNALRAARKKD